jgi:hypothetical protein
MVTVALSKNKADNKAGIAVISLLFSSVFI